MTTWMMVLALAAATDDAHMRDRLAGAPPASREVLAREDDRVHTAAEASQWTYIGPEEASISVLAVSPSDPDHLLAANSYMWNIPLQSRVMQTRSGGLEWAPVASLQDVYGKIEFMADGRAVAVGTGGVYSLAPGASSWSHHPPPGNAATFQVGGLAIGGPTGPVWVSGHVDNQPRLYRIDALGAAWLDVTPPGLGGTWLTGLAASAVHPGTAVLAVTQSFGPLRTHVTTDGGVNWYENEAQPFYSHRVNTFQLLGDRLLLGSYYPGGFNGLQVGAALGATWTPLYWGSGSNHEVLDVAGDVNDASRLWIATPAGVRHSTDGGVSWQQGSHDILGQRATQVHYDATHSRLWVALDWHGVWMSEDDGENFERRSHRLNTLPNAAITLDPDDPGQVALVLQSEVAEIKTLATSTDGGLHWTLRWNLPGGSHGARAYFDDEGTLHAAFGDGGATVVRRRTAGGEWEAIHPFPQNQGPGSASDIVPGRDPGTLVLSTRFYNYIPLAYESAIHRFEVNDLAWTQVVQGTADSAGFTLARVEVPGGVRLLALEFIDPGEGQSRLLGSDDDGRTWIELHQGLGAWNSGALCLGDEGLLMLVLEQAGRPWLYRSENAGDSWTRTAWTPTSLQEVGVPFGSIHCPGDGQQVFMGDQRGNLWWSTDGGDSFTARAADSSTWGLVEIRDIQSSIVGLYVANVNGLWVNTALARPSQRPLELGVVVTSGHMRTLARLAWHGGQSRVEIRRNGAVVAEVENTGHHTDAMLTPLRPATLQWQVCNVGTEECTQLVSD